jgi:hypothetical protein
LEELDRQLIIEVSRTKGEAATSGEGDSQLRKAIEADHCALQPIGEAIHGRETPSLLRDKHSHVAETHLVLCHREATVRIRQVVRTDAEVHPWVTVQGGMLRCRLSQTILLKVAIASTLTVVIVS